MFNKCNKYTLGPNHSCFISRSHIECWILRCFGLIYHSNTCIQEQLKTTKPLTLDCDIGYFKVWSLSSRTRSVLQYCIPSKWPSRPRTYRKWQICASEMHYTAPEYDCPVLIILTAIVSGSMNNFFFFRGSAAQRGPMASSLLRFLDHTQLRITAGRTPLDEWSARRRDLYLTTHNTPNRQT